VPNASTATIGGVLATNAHGPMKMGFGGVRDYCLGIHFVTGDGKIAKGGGKVVKNVAGYDLMKLLIGSYGSLGVITSANFKVFPAPQQTVTLICHFGTLVEAIALRDSVLKSPLSPLACEIINPAALEYLHESEPRDPDDWAPDASPRSAACWKLALRFAGSDRVLSRIRSDLNCFVSSVLGGSEEAALWKQI